MQALYAASFMGIGIAKGSLSVKVDRGAYAAKLHISTAGLARIVSSEESYIDAKGYVGRSLVPSTYELMSRGDTVTQVSMALGGGNVRNLKAIPELVEYDDRVPVTAAAKRRVVDPLSAAILPIVRDDKSDDKDVCDRTLPVFDGLDPLRHQPQLYQHGSGRCSRLQGGCRPLLGALGAGGGSP